MRHISPAHTTSLGSRRKSETWASNGQSLWTSAPEMVTSPRPYCRKSDTSQWNALFSKIKRTCSIM
ncbi:hypothetical protein CTAM01_07338 [Colletotrichum tamarilloi]|uniref:Uncharacterized protein n=1 Tax=Colletotrichum tamarilloi TaxID=1209934 RepID=A0ABQ9RA39_9PEZI|nr:uncharacterized protein CTAM01_07338 [Colletotrichum tamarilloi]KAK1498609.1 hypothetical protein CTAM01_07338 [Colletotrichum tamarilloi]